ncbi:hypothetical protein [Belliella aquatica]|uniref:Dynamin family protein n=1 Tax=Belliella aquatica TaxID=1323734 RepID=A0ABQ1MX38_9BACT|nr:hypothetical protein [Belliella aquatica]MCH7406803.1 hypothetical protein [Belliella aquatica]GGC48319.1 hypothetical protein GCM10010993_28520 [Belliella aquatica]
MHVSKIKNALKDIERIAEFSLEPGTLVHLSESLRKIENSISSENIKMDILFLGQNDDLEMILPQEFHDLWKENHMVGLSEGPFSIRVFGPSKFPIVKIDELHPVIKVIYLNDSEIEKEELKYFVDRFSKNTAFLYFILGPKIEKINPQEFSLEKIWKVLRQSSEEFNNIVTFTKQIPEPYKKVSAFISGVFGLKKLSEFLEIQMQNEQKEIDAKKIAVSKELETNKKSANSKSGQEVFQQIKNNLSKSASEFEKGIGERFGKITKIQDGSLFFNVEQEIALLKELEEVEVDGEIMLRLPKSVNQLFEWMEQQLKDHLSNDVISMNDFLSASIEEVQELLEKTGVQAANIQTEYYDKSKIQPLLDHSIRMEKDFEAKGVSKNFNSLFSAIRQPVFMVMSILMIAGFAGFNQEVQLVKDNFNILIVVLLGFGTYQAFQNISTEKRRKMTEETKKAKQHLSTEIKRILSTVEREWKQPYNDFLKKQIRDIIDNCETVLKNYSQRTSQEINDKNLLTQRKMLNINNQEKQFQNGLREKQNFDNKLNNLMAETKIEFQKLTQ